MLNVEKGQPSPIGPICEHMYTIWSCLCTILQQMADSSAKKCQMRRKVSQVQLALYMDMCTTWSCLCTIWQQMADSCATKVCDSHLNFGQVI